MPPQLRTQSELPSVDYADAFAIESPRVPERTAERWAHALLDGSASQVGHALWAVFARLGVLPFWEARGGSGDVVVRSGSTNTGLRAELMFERTEETLLFATFVHFASPLGRATWAGLSVVHRRVVPFALNRAAG